MTAIHCLICIAMVFVLTYWFDHSLTVTDTHTRSLSLTGTPIHSVPLSQSHTLVHFHSQVHSLTQYLSHRNSPICTLFITRTLTHSLDTSHRHPYTRSLWIIGTLFHSLDHIPDSLLFTHSFNSLSLIHSTSITLIHSLIKFVDSLTRPPLSLVSPVNSLPPYSRILLLTY